MKIWIYALLFCGVLSLTSCATLFCGSKKKVTFETNVPVKEAQVTVDGRKYSHVTFPWTMKVKRGFSETIVKAEAKGYDPVLLVIDKTFNPVAVLNLFGLLGWGIDAATGAMMKPESDFYELEFVPVQDSLPRE